MIVRLTESDLCIAVPPDANTLPGFRAWAASEAFPERGRSSLINGELIIDMSPERAESHNAVKAEMSAVLHQLVKDLDIGQFFADGMWITNDAAELSNEPDAMFASWESFEADRIELILREEDEDDGIELRGAPDWALEIVSPTSVRKDTRLLPVAYFRAGVREYWLVDARGESLQFTIYMRGDEGFVPVEPNDGWRRSDIFGREFRLDRRRDRIGGWSYTLHVREGAE
ncbi:MAG: Uma2 family endonuclease [Planctomycetes bacterium]|nr:Uma2 family endonuclease [Planctomycetota bacterium]